MIKTIIFDMDGVLVDACEWHRVALNLALKTICNYEISLEDHYSTFNGLPTKVKLRKLSELGILKEENFQEIETLKQEKTIDAINQQAVERKEKILLMKFLKSKNINIACYTNSIRKTAQLMLKKTGVFDYIDLLVTNEDVKNAKPSPEGYIKCIQHFNTDPDNVIIVEDSPKGIEAAMKSGARVITVKNPDDVTIELFKEYL